MAQIPFNLPPIMPSGSVETDIPCRKCGYNLRGMPLEGRCPECGTPVGVSVNGELLRYSDPAFVETLRRGISFILWGIVAIIVVVIISMALTVSGAVSPNSPVQALLGLLGALPSVIGGWLLTTPDPSGIGEDQYGTSRKVIRVSLAVGLLNNLFSFTADLAGPMSPQVQIVFGILEAGAGIVGLVGTVAQLIYLKKLAGRIPDLSLARTANTVIWGLSISDGGLLIFGLIVVIATASAGGTPSQGWLVGFGCGGGLFGLAALVFGIMYLVMLYRFGRQFRAQAAMARALWAGSHAPIPGAPPSSVP